MKIVAQTLVPEILSKKEYQEARSLIWTNTDSFANTS